MGIPPRQPHVSPIRRDQTRQHFHGGGFTRSVDSQKSQDLTRTDPEADSLNGSTFNPSPALTLTVDFMQILGNQ
ncbi:MAG: hypothetical protein OHK0012_01330 [Synechococcales cyanobacterium]